MNPREKQSTSDEQAEIRARFEAIRAAKLARLTAGLSETVPVDELDAVLPPVDSARHRAAVVRRESEKKLRAAGPLPTKCPSCKGRVNQFDGLCARCAEAAPRSADYAPITLRPHRHDSIVPMREPPKEAPEMISTPTSSAPEAKSEVSARTCHTCGQPLSSNGRCYQCRPGGGRGVPHNRKARQIATTTPVDAELAAIGVVMATLAELDVKSARRTLNYVCERLNLGRVAANDSTPRS